MLPRRSLMMLSVLCVAAPGLSRAEETVRIRGTIDAIDASSIKVTTRDGGSLTLLRDPKLTVRAIIPASLGDINPGSYIGVTTVPGSDGTLRAVEVHVVPEASRGSGEGSRPSDLEPQSMMTNGTVVDVVGTEGRTLTVNYKTGEKTVVVPENTPIVTFEPGERVHAGSRGACDHHGDKGGGWDADGAGGKRGEGRAGSADVGGRRLLMFAVPKTGASVGMLGDIQQAAAHGGEGKLMCRITRADAGSPFVCAA